MILKSTQGSGLGRELFVEDSVNKKGITFVTSKTLCMYLKQGGYRISGVLPSCEHSSELGTICVNLSP